MSAQGWLARLRLGNGLQQRGRSPRDAPRAARARRVPLAIAALVLLVGAWLWVRDSPLVAVDHVTVTGESGPEAGQIRTALRTAARSMTTLDVSMGQLRSAVAPYPAVRDLQVSVDLPHTMHIRVIKQIPVGTVVAGGLTIAVAGDGMLLRDVVPSSSLAAVPLRVLPGGRWVTDPQGRAAVSLLAAAPPQLLPHVSQVTTDSNHGLVAALRGGPSIFFGDGSDLHAKWIAASEVLADPGSVGAVYIDVSDPRRPAAGAGSNSGSGG